jgi:hypothetical protein
MSVIERQAVTFLEKAHERHGGREYLASVIHVTKDAAVEAIAIAIRSQSERVSRLEDALGTLEHAATAVSRHGAVTGPQWSRLASALIRARSALKGGDNG